MFALNRTKTATSKKLPCILFLSLFIYLFIYLFYYYFFLHQSIPRHGCYRFTHELA